MYGRITADAQVRISTNEGGQSTVSLLDFVRLGITRSEFMKGTAAKFEPLKWIQISAAATSTDADDVGGPWVSFADLYNAQVRRLMQARAGAPPPSGPSDFIKQNNVLLDRALQQRRRGSASSSGRDALSLEAEAAALKKFPEPDFSQFSRTQQQKLRAEHSKIVDKEKRVSRRRCAGRVSVRRWRDLSWGAKVGMAGMAVGFFEKSRNTVVEETAGRSLKKKPSNQSAVLAGNPKNDAVSVPLLVGYITSRGAIRCQGRDMSALEFAKRARGWSENQSHKKATKLKGWRPWTRIRDLIALCHCARFMTTTLWVLAGLREIAFVRAWSPFLTRIQRKLPRLWFPQRDPLTLTKPRTRTLDGQILGLCMELKGMGVGAQGGGRVGVTAICSDTRT